METLSAKELEPLEIEVLRASPNLVVAQAVADLAERHVKTQSATARLVFTASGSLRSA